MLTAFEGLCGLTSVAGSAEIHGNGTLANLVGLRSLGFVGGDLEICDNGVLASLDGLQGLATVIGDLGVHDNACLLQDEAMAFAASVTVGGNVNVYDNGGPCEK